MYHTVVMTCGISIFADGNIFSPKRSETPEINVSLQEKSITKLIHSIKEKYLYFSKSADEEILEKTDKGLC